MSETITTRELPAMQRFHLRLAVTALKAARGILADLTPDVRQQVCGADGLAVVDHWTLRTVQLLGETHDAPAPPPERVRTMDAEEPPP